MSTEQTARDRQIELRSKVDCAQEDVARTAAFFLANPDTEHKAALRDELVALCKVRSEYAASIGLHKSAQFWIGEAERLQAIEL
jgi:hypothetical protein